MTGYVRKDTTNNIADGNVINAADLDAEFDGVKDAFQASTGHKHDGSTGEGAPITSLGPNQDVTISATLLAPKTTNTVDIGSSALKFKDLFLAGNGSIGGTLAVTGVATLTANPVLSAGTANGVAYLNGSKVVTSGSALVFDGTNLGIGAASPLKALDVSFVSGARRFLVSYDDSVITIKGAGSTNSPEALRVIGDNIRFNTGSTGSGSEVMRLDSTGNLGLGVTPSVAGAGKTFEIGTTVGNLIRAAGQNDMNVESNTIYNSGFKYANNGFANRFGIGAATGQFQWFNAPSGTAGNAITFTQAMTLDASGNLLLGTTSALGKFHVRGTSAANMTCRLEPYTNAYASKLLMSSQSSGDGGIQYGAGGANNLDVFAYDHVIFSNGSISGSIGTERARIDSSGNLLVGKTTNNDTSLGCVIIPSDNNTGRFKATGDNSSSGASFQVTNTSGNNTFLVRPNGNVTNTNNSYGAISDAKLKENIVDATPKLADLMQVKVRSYNLIGETTKQLGVVAQELEQVFPAMVDESFDMDADGNNLSTTTKSVKYSVFVPMLIKAMQEQQAIIENLKARLDAANL